MRIANNVSKLGRIAAIAVPLVVFGCGSGTLHQAAKESVAAASAAAPEASVQIPTLEGASASINQYKGKLVLVNFWATWCAPCRTEIPWLIEFHQKYGPKGLVILGVAMDDEGAKVVRPWIQSQHFDMNGHSEAMNYQVLVGNSKIADKFGGILGMPTSMLYSRDGKRIKTIVGLIDHDDLSKTLDSQL
jgi:thiol-disulfide isomerase/thioredoxin